MRYDLRHPNDPHDGLTTRLLNPDRVYRGSEALAKPCLVPASPGVYAWWFRDTLHVPTQGCVQHDDLTLLYVGISPKAQAPNGRTSRQSLRTRVRYHYRGNAEGSTLRLTLGCLLGLPLRRVGSGTRRTFAEREAELSQWMEENAFVSWVGTSEPWLPETEIIATTSLPLNLDQNRSHAFHAELSQLRREAKASAAALPIVRA
ncbi:MAG: hypothetical protein EON57_02620 [Alphaproteobacteria bacterium]|nr:MAG: hypothetical protein EON57_02620 [Alphaproteobacteria bacterium]